MENPPSSGQDGPSETQIGSSHDHDRDKKAEIKKKLMMMEAAMPAVLAWNMFQICQSDGISPAAAARKIFQMDLTDNRDSDEPFDERSLVILQKLEDLVRYHRKLRLEFQKIEELSQFRERQMRRKVLDLESRLSRKRRLFDEMIADLNPKNLDSANNASMESISSHDLVAFEEMQRLAESEIILKKRIAELEKKERFYLKTLQQADELWTALKSKNG